MAAVVPFMKFSYNEEFMNHVDKVLDDENTPPENIYISVVSSNSVSKDYDNDEGDPFKCLSKPRKNSFKSIFKTDADKRLMTQKTQRRKLDTMNRYYFISLVDLEQLKKPSPGENLDQYNSRDTDGPNTANSKYGKIYDKIIESSQIQCKGYTRNFDYYCIIYATDIEAADKLFTDAVKNQTITLDDMTMKSPEYGNEKRTTYDAYYIRKIEKMQKEEKAKKDNEAKIANGKEIQDAIASIKPEDVLALAWRVFTIDDIADAFKNSINVEQPNLKKAVSDVIVNDNISEKELDLNRNRNKERSLKTSDIPTNFSWIQEVNQSPNIFVIKLQRTDENDNNHWKYRILMKYSLPESMTGYNKRNYLNAASYRVSVTKINTDNDSTNNLTPENMFKKKLLTPFVNIAETVAAAAASNSTNTSSDEVLFFVLNADSENTALNYFLRKYGIHYAISVQAEKTDTTQYLFYFTHDDYVDITLKKNNGDSHYYLGFGYYPLTLHSAICKVRNFFKNKQLIENPPTDTSTSNPEVCVLSQLTKDKIKNASSIDFVVKEDTSYRFNDQKLAIEGRQCSDAVRFSEYGVVRFHLTTWDLGMLSSILNEPTCITYNEIKLAVSNLAAFKNYLSTFTFPEGTPIVTRGSDEYCRLVLLEPYGNLFDPNGVIIPKQETWSSVQHPVFYVLNAPNKEILRDAITKKIEEERRKVIWFDREFVGEFSDHDKMIHRNRYRSTTALNENEFFKSFKRSSISPFIESVIKGEPDKTLLQRENIELGKIGDDINALSEEQIKAIEEKNRIKIAEYRQKEYNKQQNEYNNPPNKSDNNNNYINNNSDRSLIPPAAKPASQPATNGQRYNPMTRRFDFNAGGSTHKKRTKKSKHSLKNKKRTNQRKGQNSKKHRNNTRKNKK
jgi:hypothetical protein